MNHKPIDFPKSRQQKQFEDLAANLIKIMADLKEEQQNYLFEYAIQLHKERNSRYFTKWDEMEG